MNKVQLPDEVTKACAYLRSATGDAEATSKQRASLLDFANRCKYDIVQWYSDNGSAKPDRGGLMRLLADAPKSDWQVVLVYDRSRLTRLGAFEEERIKQTLREAGKNLHYYVDEPLGRVTPAARIMDTIQAEATHDYQKRLANASLRGRLEAFLGRRPHGQKCPYGMARRIYDPRGRVLQFERVDKFETPKGWTHTLVPGDSKEVETVRWIFKTFATQDVDKMWIARQLNARSVPAPAGGSWTAANVGRVLTNPVYVGDARFGHLPRGKFFRLDGNEIRPNTPGLPGRLNSVLVIRNAYEAIIDRATCAKVLDKLKRVLRHQPSQCPFSGGPEASS